MSLSVLGPLGLPGSELGGYYCIRVISHTANLQKDHANHNNKNDTLNFLNNYQVLSNILSILSVLSQIILIITHRVDIITCVLQTLN